MKIIWETLPFARGKPNTNLILKIRVKSDKIKHFPAVVKFNFRGFYWNDASVLKSPFYDDRKKQFQKQTLL